MSKNIEKKLLKLWSANYNDGEPVEDRPRDMVSVGSVVEFIKEDVAKTIKDLVKDELSKDVEFKVGDIVKNKNSTRVGMIVYIHPTDDIPLVVDYGDDWSAVYTNEARYANKTQREKYIKKYGYRGV